MSLKVTKDKGMLHILNPNKGVEACEINDFMVALGISFIIKHSHFPII